MWPKIFIHGKPYIIFLFGTVLPTATAQSPVPKIPVSV